MEEQNNLFDSINVVSVTIYIAIIAASILVIWVMLRINRRIFRGIQKKKQELHLKFFERASSAVILFGGILITFSMFGGLDSVWQSILGGTAVVSGIVAFAAQDVIKDILAGLMISLYRPVEIGNRVEIDDGTIGIVSDITMRHVVLRGMDTTYIIIPNSKFNTMKLVNYSFGSSLRAAKFIFNIALGSDVEKAKSIILDAVKSSELSVPGLPDNGELVYADVYFMAYRGSGLELATTVYYENGTRSEVLISDINTRVNEALKSGGIEIPYMYVNIIEKKSGEDGEIVVHS